MKQAFKLCDYEKYRSARKTDLLRKLNREIAGKGWVAESLKFDEHGAIMCLINEESRQLTVTLITSASIGTLLRAAFYIADNCSPERYAVGIRRENYLVEELGQIMSEELMASFIDDVGFSLDGDFMAMENKALFNENLEEGAPIMIATAQRVDLNKNTPFKRRVGASLATCWDGDRMLVRLAKSLFTNSSVRHPLSRRALHGSSGIPPHILNFASDLQKLEKIKSMPKKIRMSATRDKHFGPLSRIVTDVLSSS